ncbi:MAG: L-rhamnose mutarotase [Sphingobacteriales bacterium]|jgi:L-rhamnose mutarotase|nr:MAG: L-rhamnose mutarotase [Sphingobacteriales bacterium]
MQRTCLTLDLVDDATLIAEYEKYHEKIWPEIEKSIKDSGIITMQIYRLHTRMFMIIEAEDWFTFEAKGKADATNPKVQEWEQLMWKYQAALPQAKPGEKWLLMKKIFEV